MKRDTNGNKIKWFGWKLRIVCDSKSELPLDILITPASVCDGTVMIKLIQNSLITIEALMLQTIMLWTRDRF